MKMKLAAIIVILASFGGCAYLEKAKQSEAFKHFCTWAPVAVVGINQSATEAEQDPAKIQVANAMREATRYIELIATQCPKPGA